MLQHGTSMRLTALHDRQVAMYRVILESGSVRGVFSLKDSIRSMSRNLVALEDAYGYRMMARHSAIIHRVRHDT